MVIIFDLQCELRAQISHYKLYNYVGWVKRNPTNSFFNELALSTIAVPELIYAFCRLHREGVLNSTQYEQIKADYSSLGIAK